MQNENTVSAEEKAVKFETAELLSTEATEKVLVIRKDEPAKVYERQKVKIVGILSTPALYLEKRIHVIEPVKSHVIVNREKMTIDMVVHEEDYFQHIIAGKLEMHPDFIAFGVNAKTSWEPFALAEFIRMNRTFFETIDFAVNLVTKLKTFKAKVATEQEKIEKQNGDFRSVFDQTVQHNLPEKFTLKMPIFKGYNPISFEVEVHVNPADLSMRLISPAAKDEQQTLKDKAINEQLETIKTIAPGLLITEE